MLRVATTACCLLLAVPVLAQSPPPMLPPRTQSMPDRITERIGAQLGALVIENVGLSLRVGELQEQVSALQKRIMELEPKAPPPAAPAPGK